MTEPEPILRANLGDGKIILRRNGHTEVLNATIVEPMHMVATKRGSRTRMYLNGFRVRRPLWFFEPIRRWRERRFARTAIG